jgi:hypothetical protein
MMAKQRTPIPVWDFAIGAYVPSDEATQVIGHTMTLGSTGSGKTTYMHHLLDAKPSTPGAKPDADCAPVQ